MSDSDQTNREPQRGMIFAPTTSGYATPPGQPGQFDPNHYIQQGALAQSATSRSRAIPGGQDTPPPYFPQIHRCSLNHHSFTCKHEDRCECGKVMRDRELETDEGL